jgi:endonuclease/exonuclease/phosphatase family metal-dependent hydrolase
VLRSLLCAALAALLLAVGLVGCGSAGPQGVAVFAPEPPPTYDAHGLRLATLNAYFLFDTTEASRIDYPRKGNAEAVAAHLDRLGDALRALDADLVMLQEVADRAIVERLLREALPDAGYTPYFVQGRDTFTGQDVALLARVPVDSVFRTDERAPVAGTRGQTYGVSKNLAARLTLGGLPVTLVGVHFLAIPPALDRKPRREAQAEVIRRLVAREMEAGRAVAVLGDFNDYDDAVPDRRGHRPVTDVLATVKAAGPGPADDLRTVMAEVPQADRFTAHYDRNDSGTVDDEAELSAIDHVLLSPALYARLRGVAYAQFYDPAAVTDHFPVVVTLDTTRAAGAR